MEFATVYTVLTYVDTLVTFIIPFLAIVICNVRIVYKITNFYGKRNLVKEQSIEPSSCSLRVHTTVIELIEQRLMKHFLLIITKKP